MIHSVMLLIPQIHQAIIGLEIVTMYRTVNIYLALYNALQSLPGAVRYYFGIHFPVSFKNTKHYSLTSCTTASFPTYSLCPKVRFINLNFSFERRFFLTYFLLFSFSVHSISY